jgi:hypothetical protein
LLISLRLLIELSLRWYLKEEFKDDLMGQIADPEISKNLSEIGGKMISSSSLNMSDIRGDLVSNYSTFGIGIGLALLGTFLAKKYRKSKAARILAKIFGADVEQMDRSYVLQRLVNDKDYFQKVKKGITEILPNGNLNQLIKYFASEFDLREEDALEVYMQIKDVILDSQIIGSISQISARIGELQTRTSTEFSNIKNSMSQQFNSITKNMNTILEQQITKIEETFINSLAEFSLSQANFKIYSQNTKIGKGDKNCWKLGYFSEREIKSNYDVRRPITDQFLESVEENFGTMLYGKPYDGKSTLLKRIMLEEIENEGYIVIFCDKVVANEAIIKIMLTKIVQQFPKILVIVDNAHSSGTEEIFKVYNHFQSIYNSTDRNSNDINSTITTKIRFLFAARIEEMNQFTNFLKSNDRRELEYAKSYINGPIEIDFGFQDSILFVRKALETTNNKNMLSSDNDDDDPNLAPKRIATDIFNASHGDPLMFGCHLRSLISQIEKHEKNVSLDDIMRSIIFLDCIGDDFKDKKTFLDSCNDNELFRAAVLCVLMGSFDIALSREKLQVCGVYRKNLTKLAQNYFLIETNDRNNNSHNFQIRHPRWGIEFLSYLYRETGNDFIEFEHEYRIKDIFSCILENTSLHDHLNILKLCVSLYSEFSKAIIQNFKVPATLANDENLMLQEQLAFSLNRIEQGEKAEKMLLELIDKKRGRSETYGILGRIYKDRWEKAYIKGDNLLSSEMLNKAIEIYFEGFKADQNDAYPGINAVTLMEIKEPPDPRRLDILPLVKDAAKRRIKLGKPDYWDYATYLEVAVLTKDKEEAMDSLSNAMDLIREPWEAQSTLRNLRLIREARERRQEAAVEWTKQIEQALNR